MSNPQLKEHETTNKIEEKWGRFNATTERGERGEMISQNVERTD